MLRPVFRREIGRTQFPSCAADRLVHGDTQAVETLVEVDETVLGILLPVPVGGQVAQAAEPGLAEPQFRLQQHVRSHVGKGAQPLPSRQGRSENLEHAPVGCLAPIDARGRNAVATLHVGPSPLVHPLEAGPEVATPRLPLLEFRQGGGGIEQGARQVEHLGKAVVVEAHTAIRPEDEQARGHVVERRAQHFRRRGVAGRAGDPAPFLPCHPRPRPAEAVPFAGGQQGRQPQCQFAHRAVARPRSQDIVSGPGTQRAGRQRLLLRLGVEVEQQRQAPAGLDGPCRQRARMRRRHQHHGVEARARAGPFAQGEPGHRDDVPRMPPLPALRCQGCRRRGAFTGRPGIDPSDPHVRPPRRRFPGPWRAPPQREGRARARKPPAAPACRTDSPGSPRSRAA